MKWTTEVAFSSGERELTGSVLQGFEGRQKMGLTIDEGGGKKRISGARSVLKKRFDFIPPTLTTYILPSYIEDKQS